MPIGTTATLPIAGFSMTTKPRVLTIASYPWDSVPAEMSRPSDSSSLNMRPAITRASSTLPAIGACQR